MGVDDRRREKEEAGVSVCRLVNIFESLLDTDVAEVGVDDESSGDEQGAAAAAGAGGGGAEGEERGGGEGKQDKES